MVGGNSWRLSQQAWVMRIFLATARILWGGALVMLSCHGLAVHLWILTSPLQPKLDSQWMKSRTGRKCLNSSPLVDKTPETSCTSNFYVTSTNKIKIRLSKDHHIYTTKPRPRTIQTFHPHPHQRLQILCKGWLFEVQFTIEIRVNHTKGLSITPRAFTHCWLVQVSLILDITSDYHILNALPFVHADNLGYCKILQASHIASSSFSQNDIFVYIPHWTFCCRSHQFAKLYLCKSRVCHFTTILKTSRLITSNELV